MVWRGSTTPLDRIFAALVYVIPLIEAYLSFSGPLLNELPFLSPIFIVLWPFIIVYGFIVRLIPLGLGGLVIFFALYFLVVRNDRIRHLIRFSAMQSILIGIILSIFSILWELILTAFGALTRNSLFLVLNDTLFSLLFLGTLAATVYSIVYAVQGKYGEIPKISDYAYMYVRS
ncbi:MAG: Tic20 family protein [Leptolyngbyaceae bacterium]|nr:Tic20 family protein [Leptolyngbyaceae bacterium]